MKISFHVKLNLMKQFVKALSIDSECFQYIVSTFAALFFERIKTSAFYEPQMQVLLCNEEFVR